MFKSCSLPEESGDGEGELDWDELYKLDAMGFMILLDLAVWMGCDVSRCLLK